MVGFLAQYCPVRSGCREEEVTEHLLDFYMLLGVGQPPDTFLLLIFTTTL